MNKIAGRELKVVIFVGLLAFLSWVALDNKLYFDFFNALKTKAATSGTASNFMAINVAASLTAAKCASTAWAASSTVTSGTPITSTHCLQVTTNDNFTVSAGRKRANKPYALASSGAATTYYIPEGNGSASGGVDVFTGCTSSVAKAWAAAASTGLGYSNWGAKQTSTQTSVKNTTCWGTGTTETDASNLYAALEASASASSFISTDGTTTGLHNLSIGYKLDVSSTQRATRYDGTVVYTATTVP